MSAYILIATLIHQGGVESFDVQQYSTPLECVVSSHLHTKNTVPSNKGQIIVYSCEEREYF